MKVYHYKAATPQGQIKKGLHAGESAKVVRRALRQQGLLPIELKEEMPSSARMRSVDLTLFTRQLANLIRTGAPIEEALAILSQSFNHQQAMIRALSHAIAEGQSLAHALARYPRCFPAVYRAAIHAAESGGYLPTILEHLAQHAQRQHAMRQKLLQASIYPLVVTGIAMLIVSFLLIFAVPNLLMVFQTSHQALPLITQMLLGLSGFFSNNGLFLLLGLIVAGGLYRHLLKRDTVRVWRDQCLLKWPLFGYFVRSSNTARYISTLGMLMMANVPLLNAMKMAAELVVNAPIRSALIQAENDVREGEAIHQALKKTGHFQPMALYFIQNGEQTGQLSTALQQVSQHQEDELTRFINIIMTLFEPCMILVMGGVVLFIVLAILLPIFSINDLVSL